MSLRRFTELSLLVATTFWLHVPMAGARNVFVVITPPVARPQPAPQHAFPPQPPLQWAPSIAMGPIPGPRSPAPLCYTGGSACPAQADRVGGSCTCGGGSGRALIPPSTDASGKPTR